VTAPVATATSHTIRQGVTIDTTLTNQLNGTAAGPITVRVSNPMYGYDGQLVLIPQGATILGWVTPVGSVYDSRLTVAFHLLQMPPPDGRSYSLDQFKGLNQIGEVGLRDKVNNHYVEKFGMAAAIGFITAVPQALSNAAQRRSNTNIVLGGIGDQSSQLSQQMFQQTVNRPPDLVQRAGDRVKVHVANDIVLPAWGRTR
jgi:type IV secretion system protein TrbI